MNEIIVQSEIGERILTLRGKEVMLDRDLAELFKEQKQYTAIGSYWERGNKNEIDIVAVDDWEKKILICEVKLQEKRLNLGELVTKSEKLLQKYSDHDVEYRLLSVKDLKNYCN